jgi:2-polyprenyl-6-methoxyphenol hydroxylase-like FAD-dependent oxidoreductase
MRDEILVVGAGPTGLTAALELARMGVAVRVIDKRDTPATTSRAIGVQARTLELFEQRGIAEELVELGNKGGYGSVYGGGKRVFRLDFTKIESHYPYLLFVSQAETERVLRDALARYGVQPEWQTELIAIRQDALSHDESPVRAVVRNPDGRLQEMTTPWLIGAEGAHSLIRTTLDLPYEGHTREEQYALGDLLIDSSLADTDFHIFSSDHGFMGLFPMGGEHFRLIASHPLSTPSHDTAPDLDELQKIYDQRSAIPARFHDLGWSSWFRINSRMVSRLRIGRLLVGGDAAHIHSPAGAQGMNTGIQDMINLSWKLAHVMNHGAPVSLIDSYEADRLPVMRNVLGRTDGLTSVIGSENAVVRTLFNHIGPFIGSAGVVQENATANMSQIALNYRDSPLSENHSHSGELRAGDRIPELSVQVFEGNTWRTTRLVSLLDPSKFTLLVATQRTEARADLPADEWVRIAPADDPVAAAQFGRVFGQRGAAVLVRPDGYAAMTSSVDDAQRNMSDYQERWLKC